MSFYEDYRIRKKNALYNFPDEETNREACVLLRDYDNANMGKLAQYDDIKAQMKYMDTLSHRMSVLETALIILARK